MSDYERAVFLSYARGGEHEEIVDEIDRALQARGIKILRDKRDVGYKDSIRQFMERIGQGNCVIVVISDKYLRSPNCMFELVEIAEGKQFHDRIFPIVLNDANIYDPVRRLDYVKYWEMKRGELAQAMREVDPANLQGIREDIDQYDRIRDKISGLTSILKDMNTLTPDLHRDSDFSHIYDAIEKRLNESEPERVSNFVKIEPFEPETIHISAGTFVMSNYAKAGDPDHAPSQYEVHLPDYRIGKSPVTNNQYKIFLQQTGKLATTSMGWEGQRIPKGLENQPVTGITWYEALSYCKWLKDKTGREYSLPTEAEWEKACQSGGFDSFEYVGNIRQWTRTLWGEDSITPDPQFADPRDIQSNDLNASSMVRRVIRGGVVSDPDKEAIGSIRSSDAPDRPGPPGKRIGFRVALKVPSSQG
jgi:hypothetical protein